MTPNEDRYPDGELPKLIDQVIKNVLSTTYENGLYHEQKVHDILTKITPLDGFQIHAYFSKLQVSGNDPPRRQEFMCIQHQKALGQWTDEKRSILEKCFKEDICTPDNFAFIGLLTALSKNQISNWTRQKRYLLRKKGLLPPANKSKTGGGSRQKRKRKGVQTNTGLKRSQVVNRPMVYASHRKDGQHIQSCSMMLAPISSSLQNEKTPKVDDNCSDAMLEIPQTISFPQGAHQFFLNSGLGGSEIDSIGSEILRHANQSGLLDDQESLHLVALVSGIEFQNIVEWKNDL